MHWIVETARHYLQAYGYWAVLVALLGENAGLPLPGETILILASFLAYQGHHLQLPWVILIGICACTMGDNIGYWIGRRGGRPLLEKWKHFFRISDETIKAGEEFLQRRGSVAIFLARFIAGMRIVAGPLAGVLRMEWKRFLPANAAGAAAWVTVIAGAGYFFGSQYEALAGVVKQTEVVIFLAVVLAALHLWRNQRKRSQQRRREQLAEPANRQSRNIKV
ncbi:MAG: DedA family protein [Acidobacteriia bacterium]|nr:DedA family protein [Terriglobia bacterium]